MLFLWIERALWTLCVVWACEGVGVGARGEAQRTRGDTNNSAASPMKAFLKGNRIVIEGPSRTKVFPDNELHPNNAILQNEFPSRSDLLNMNVLSEMNENKLSPGLMSLTSNLDVTGNNRAAEGLSPTDMKQIEEMMKKLSPTAIKQVEEMMKKTSRTEEDKSLTKQDLLDLMRHDETEVKKDDKITRQDFIDMIKQNKKSKKKDKDRRNNDDRELTRQDLLDLVRHDETSKKGSLLDVFQSYVYDIFENKITFVDEFSDWVEKYYDYVLILLVAALAVALGFVAHFKLNAKIDYVSSFHDSYRSMVIPNIIENISWILNQIESFEKTIDRSHQ